MAVNIDGNGLISLGGTNSSQGKVEFFEDTDNGTNFVALQAAAAIAANVIFTLPSADGANGQVIQTNGSGALSFVTPAGGASDKIEEGDSKVEVTDTGANGTIVFNTDNAERMRVDSSGRLLVGTSSTFTGAPNPAEGGTQTRTTFFVTNLNTTNQGVGIYSFSSAGFAPSLDLAAAQTSTIGSYTAVGNDYGLGYINFGGADGSKFVTGASIFVQVDGTPGANDMPARLIFSTTADGSASPTERMRIKSNGDLILAGSTAQKASGTTWSNPSDQRLKNNIRDYGNGLAELVQVRVREWEYNGKGGTTEGSKGIGVVADEVMSVLPNTVNTYKATLNEDDQEPTDIKRFDATEITWLLVKAVQELKAELDQAKTRIAALENNNA